MNGEFEITDANCIFFVQVDQIDKYSFQSCRTQMVKMRQKPQAAQALFMNHTRMEHNMASNYKGLYEIFHKITMKVVKSVNIQ